jgi:hypothetical protein
LGDHRGDNSIAMKSITTIALGLLMSVAIIAGQNTNDSPEAHVARAKTAAGNDYQNLFNFLCPAPSLAHSPDLGGEEGRQIAQLGTQNL